MAMGRQYYHVYAISVASFFCILTHTTLNSSIGSDEGLKLEISALKFVMVANFRYELN